MTEINQAGLWKWIGCGTVWLPLAVADSKGERPPSPFGLRMNFQLAAFPYKTHMVLDDAADTLSFAFFSKFLDPQTVCCSGTWAKKVAQLAACSVVRTSVCSWRTFPDLRLIHG